MEIQPDGRLDLRIRLIVGLVLLLVSAPVVLDDTRNMWWICVSMTSEGGRSLRNFGDGLKGGLEDEKELFDSGHDLEEGLEDDQDLAEEEGRGQRTVTKRKIELSF